MFDPTTYKPDRLVVDGGEWVRNTLGLKNYQFSHLRVGAHVHMLNCMFDMVTLCAVVETHASGYSTVTKTGSCHICEAPGDDAAARRAEEAKVCVGEWVSLFVSESPDRVSGIVRAVYRDAIGVLVADVKLPSGEVRSQCVEFLTRL